jgi:tight adherence protein B
MVIAVALGNALFGPVGLIAGLLVVPIVARTYVKRALKGKRKAFADQLPDSLDVLSSAIRAGYSLVGGLSVVANDAAEPSRTEFHRVLAEEQFGVQIEDALLVTAMRMANRDIEQLSLVARLQREMGANTAEVLDRVVETVRGRMELRRLVGSLTAQGRLSRWILTLMPIGLAIFIEMINPSYMSPLFNTISGEVMLGLAALMVTIGSVVIGKIVDIKA